MLAQVATQVLTKEKGGKLAKPDKVWKLQLSRHLGGEQPPLPKEPGFPADRKAFQVSLGNNWTSLQDWGWRNKQEGGNSPAGTMHRRSQDGAGVRPSMKPMHSRSQKTKQNFEASTKDTNGHYRTSPTYLSIVEALDTLRFSNSFISVPSKRFVRSMVEGRERSSSVFVNSHSKKIIKNFYILMFLYNRSQYKVMKRFMRDC